MSGLNSLVESVRATVKAAPSVLMLGQNTDWKTVIADIDAKAEAVAVERDALAVERDNLITTGIVANDPASTKKGGQVRVQVDELERQLESLTKARRRAAHALDLEEMGRAGAAEQARDAAVKRQTKKVHDAAKAADEALGKFRDAMGSLASALGELRAMAGPELHDPTVGFQIHLPLAVNAALSEAFPRNFQKSTLLPVERLSIAGNAERCFEIEFIAAIAQRRPRVA